MQLVAELISVATQSGKSGKIKENYKSQEKIRVFENSQEIWQKQTYFVFLNLQSSFLLKPANGRNLIKNPFKLLLYIHESLPCRILWSKSFFV